MGKEDGALLLSLQVKYFDLLMATYIFASIYIHMYVHVSHLISIGSIACIDILRSKSKLFYSIDIDLLSYYIVYLVDLINCSYIEVIQFVSIHALITINKRQVVRSSYIILWF